MVDTSWYLGRPFEYDVVFEPTEGFMPLILPKKTHDEIKADKHKAIANEASLELPCFRDRYKVASLLQQLHFMFQTTPSIKLPDDGRNQLRKRLVERLAEDLLGDDVAFEELT